MAKDLCDHWYVIDNRLSISFMKFAVTIKTLLKDNKIFYVLTVYDSDMNEIPMEFYDLESAVEFSEEVIAKSKNIREIVHLYKEMYYNKNERIKRQGM